MNHSLSPAVPELTIDLQALKANYALIASRLKPGCRMSAVVKADAYGLGVEAVANQLKSLKCNDFFVFSPSEALTLRAVLPAATIYVLSGCPVGWESDLSRHNLIPCLSGLPEIERYALAARRAGRSLPAIIQFDTGMNRLGLGPDETLRLVENKDLLNGLDIKMIMSHFLAADEQGDPYTPAQAERFAAIAKHFPDTLKSLSNSAGVFCSPDYHYDVVRPGMALYGLNPIPHETNPMRPVVSLHVPVLQTRTAQKNDVVGYSATYRFDRDTPMATVAMGYADGILRSLSNTGTLFWKGYPCPVRGRVSMDLVTISLDNIPEGERPQEGDMMEVLGPHQSADDLAKAAGTIGYEILTSLGARYRRVYK